MKEIVEYYCGPRTVISNGDRPIISLPRDFWFLRGRRVMLHIIVLPEPVEKPEVIKK